MNLDGPTLRLARDARAAGEALAHRPAFAIGPLGVHPSACSIRWGDGPDRPVQPLAMRVLTALAEAQGETYSRDDLLATCWNARIVGDDAIHRVISQLRRDLRAVAGDAVRIDTIARVGYRLRVIDGTNAAEERAGEAFAAPSTADRPKRRWLWPCVAVTAAAMAAAAAVMLPSAPAAGTTIAVEPVAGGAAGLLTDDLTDELASLASPIVGLTFIEAGPGSGRPNLILRVSLGRSAIGPDSHVRLVDGETGAVVWSRAFEARDPSLAALRERIAYSVGGLIHCGLDRSATAFSEPVSRRLYLNACDALNEADWPRARAYGERIAALRPEVAASWACLAVTTISSSPVVRGANDTVNQRAMGYARRALAVDPHSGMAYVALAAALDRQGRSSFSTLEKGRELDPDHAPVQAYYSLALMRAGYVDAAVEPMRRAAALQPDSKALYDVAFYTMLLGGRRAEAEALNRRMQLLWVEDPLLPAQHSALVSHAPDPVAALKHLGEGASAAEPSAPTLELLRWRAAPGSYQWARFDRMAEHEFASDSDAAWNTAYLAGRMGDQRRALAWLERAPADRSGAWTVLFSPEAAALRRDPRFFAKMAELGLVDFWQARGKWPDFCSDHGLRYDCRQEARRMIARAPGDGRLSELSPV